MGEYLGVLESETKHATVSSAIGGFVFVVSVRDKRGKSKSETRRYALNVREALEYVIQRDEEFRTVPHAPRLKSK
jgi:hypothetical protein